MAAMFIDILLSRGHSTEGSITDDCLAHNEHFQWQAPRLSSLGARMQSPGRQYLAMLGKNLRRVTTSINGRIVFTL